MKLTEFAEILQRDLIVRFSPDCSATKGKWMASIKNADYKEHSGSKMLAGGCGYGQTAYQAIVDYCNYLKQFKIIVLDATIETRKEFGIPSNLEAE